MRNVVLDEIDTLLELIYEDIEFWTRRDEPLSAVQREHLEWLNKSKEELTERRNRIA